MNHAVQRIVLAVCAAAVVTVMAVRLQAAVSYPSRPDNYIYDGAAIISPSDYETIARFLTELDQKTSAQVGIVTVPTTQPESIEQYAVKLFGAWGIGQKGKDNGVLFLIAKNDHKMRIEVGYGLEGAIPDAIANQIINAIVVPEFKQSNFSQGILKGTTAIVSLIAKEYNVAVTGQENNVYNQVRSTSSDDSFIWIIMLLLLFFVFLPLFWGGYNNRGYGGGGHWYGGGGGGFGSGGGFSGGGFGGFGGGMSGGGGSSGGW